MLALNTKILLYKNSFDKDPLFSSIQCLASCTKMFYDELKPEKTELSSNIEDGSRYSTTHDMENRIAELVRFIQSYRFLFRKKSTTREFQIYITYFLFFVMRLDQKKFL